MASSASDAVPPLDLQNRSTRSAASLAGSRAKVDDGSLHPVSQPADFHKVALLQGRTHLREQVVHFVEEALDHLPHHVSRC